MLTRDQTKKRIVILIVLNSIALAGMAGAITFMILGKYYGFSQNTTITCSDSYFKLKYTSHYNFLSASFVGALLSLASSIILLVDLIVSWTKIGKIEDNQINTMAYSSIIHFYIFASLSMFGCLIPLGYMASIIVEAGKKCSANIGLNQLIIVGTTGLAEILFIVCWIILLKLSVQLDQIQQEVKQQKQVQNDVKIQPQQQIKKQQQGKNEGEILKEQQLIKDLSIIKEISMVKEDDNRSATKDKVRQMEIEMNKQEDKNTPLLNKSIYEQYKENSQVPKEKSFIDIFRQSQVKKNKLGSEDEQLPRQFLQVNQPIQRKKSDKTIKQAESFVKQPIIKRQFQKINMLPSYQQKQQKQPQIKIHKSVPPAPFINQHLYQNKINDTTKVQKVEVEVKPTQSLNTTHVTINFPALQSSNFPQAIPQSNNNQGVTKMQVPPSQLSENTNAKHKYTSKRKKHQEQIINESIEQYQSSDSDDYYYKRERKSKKRNFNLDRDNNTKSSKKGRFHQNQPNYQRDFQGIPSRFKQAPSQPRYIVLSPQSVRTFQDFLKEQKSSKQKSSRHFGKFQAKQPVQVKIQNPIQIVKKENENEIKRQQKPIQIKHQQINLMIKENARQIKKQQLIKKKEIPINSLVTQQIKKSDQSSQIKERSYTPKNKQGRKSIKRQLRQKTSSSKDQKYYQSEVKQFSKQQQKNIKKQGRLKQLDSKQKSIYQQLNVLAADSQDQAIKKYKDFFKSSGRKMQKEKQQPGQPNSSLQQYFNLLNSRVGNQNSYNSLSNYSSVLNEQSRGKIPEEREKNTNKNINLEKNRIETPRKIQSNRKSQQNLIQKIRHKYH